MIFERTVSAVETQESFVRDRFEYPVELDFLAILNKLTKASIMMLIINKILFI